MVFTFCSKLSQDISNRRQKLGVNRLGILSLFFALKANIFLVCKVLKNFVYESLFNCHAFLRPIISCLIF